MNVRLRASVVALVAAVSWTACLRAVGERLGLMS